MKFKLGSVISPLTDLYGNVVGEITIDQDGKITGKIDPDSFWISITRVGSLGIVRTVSITPNIEPTDGT